MRRLTTLVALSFMLLLPAAAYPSSVVLTWDAPVYDGQTPAVDGYKIYYGTASQKYSVCLYPGFATTYTVDNLPNGTYYFAVTSYDIWGNESGYSDEVSRTVSAEIESLSPDRGVEGTPVTITGTNFGAKKGKVYFGTKKAKITAWSPGGDSITVVPPKKLPYGTYDVSVVATDKSISGNTKPYQVMRAVVTGATAATGAPGAAVTLAGEYLGPKPKVQFVYVYNGAIKKKSAKVTGFAVDDELNCSVSFTVPQLGPGTYGVIVANSQGESEAISFDVLPTP